MAANLTNHIEIAALQTISGNTDQTMAVNEKAGNTFLKGVPVMLDASGRLIEWDGTSFTGGSGTGIAGVSLMKGSNLATDGAGAPGVFTGVGFPGATLTDAGVPNEASAVNIYRGVPATEGRGYFNVATLDTMFVGQVDNSAFAVAADATPVQADIGKEFGMTKDTTGHWYVDRAKVTVGTNTCVIVRALDPRTGVLLNGNVFFQFKNAVTQFGH